MSRSLCTLKESWTVLLVHSGVDFSRKILGVKIRLFWRMSQQQIPNFEDDNWCDDHYYKIWNNAARANSIRDFLRCFGWYLHVKSSENCLCHRTIQFFQSAKTTIHSLYVIYVDFRHKNANWRCHTSKTIPFVFKVCSTLCSHTASTIGVVGSAVALSINTSINTITKSSKHWLCAPATATAEFFLF